MRYVCYVFLFGLTFVALPQQIVAQEGSIAVVRHAYEHVWKKVGKDDRGLVLCTLRENPIYTPSDFTPELYGLILLGGRSFTDYRAGKRKDFLDCEPLTRNQSNELRNWPTYSIERQSTDEAIVLVHSNGRGYRSLHAPIKPFCDVTYAYRVLVTRDGRSWKVADVLPDPTGKAPSLRQMLREWQ